MTYKPWINSQSPSGGQQRGDSAEQQSRLERASDSPPPFRARACMHVHRSWSTDIVPTVCPVKSMGQRTTPAPRLLRPCVQRDGLLHWLQTLCVLWALTSRRRGSLRAVKTCPFRKLLKLYAASSHIPRLRRAGTPESVTPHCTSSGGAAGHPARHV
eukprot:365812-Chlamydomonas_euryale.AAC.3